MNHHYRDITDRLGMPQWWDENAVPRYCDFEPRATANIYASEAVLLAIKCQSCGYPFNVAMTYHPLDRKSLRELVEADEIHYGDPPNVGCCPAGPTMNSEPVRVVEFWHQGSDFEWVRVAHLEREIACEWAAPPSRDQSSRAATSEAAPLHGERSA